MVLSIDAFCGIPEQAANLVGHAFADGVKHTLVGPFSVSIHGVLA
jgi:hypothetical protein